MSILRELYAPFSPPIPDDLVAFLHWLERPCWIEIPGADNRRCRVVVTLLHGNEPSGVKALHQWLQRAPVPAVTTYVCIANIDAALAEPLFSHRHLPEQRDMNRCFDGPYDDHPGQFARALLDKLHTLAPEAVLDIHNTSGTGPAFGVVTRDLQSHHNLVSFFAQRTIVTNVRLGALMEQTSERCPVVTIECGGAAEPAADAVAAEGLDLFLMVDEVRKDRAADWPIEVLKHPYRVILSPGAQLRFDSRRALLADLTLPPSVEHHNFGVVAAGTPLGWLGNKGVACLRAYEQSGENIAPTLFYDDHGILRTRCALKMFMITTNQLIATEDCLFYAVRV